MPPTHSIVPILASFLTLVSFSICPAHAKTHRTFYTEAMVAKARQKVATQEWAQKQLEGFEKDSQFLVAMSDEELWNFIPPAEQFRGLNVHFGSDCPVHGAEIHRKGGHYPWIISREKPFKVECPVGHEVYPSNDFKPPWVEGKSCATPQTSSPTEKYVDEGAGWVNEKGERYWFVAYYVLWQRWQKDIIPGLKNLSQAYMLTGNPIYGHKCAVMLARLSEQYPLMNLKTQAYWVGSPATWQGRILDRIWETGTVSNFALAYDAVFPATDLKADSELAAFLQTKGIADLRGAIEENILHVMARDLMSNLLYGNQGMHQKAMMHLAIVLDQRPVDKVGAAKTPVSPNSLPNKPNPA